MMNISAMLAHLKQKQLKRIMAVVFCLQILDDTYQIYYYKFADDKSRVLHDV
jgi:hypothetical protein